MPLTIEQRSNIKTMNSLGIRKTFIKKKIGCARGTVYNTLERIKPRDGSKSSLSTKTRKGPYKITAQIESNVVQYFILHRFSSHLDCIRDLKLPIKSPTTIGNILRSNGIHTRVALKKPFVNAQNQLKRYLPDISFMKSDFNNSVAFLILDISTQNEF